MDKKEREQYSAILFIFLFLSGIFLLLDFYYRFGYSLSINKYLDEILFEGVVFTRNNIFLIRGILLISLVGMGYIFEKPKTSILFAQYKYVNVPIFLFSSFLFIQVGYTTYLYYNIIAFPLISIIASFSSYQLLRTLNSTIQEEDNELDKIYSAKDNEDAFIIPTSHGPLFIEKPQMGMYAEGSAGSGKSVFATQIIHQSVKKEFAAYLYDFEGDYNEDGALLTKHVYTAILNKYKSSAAVIQTNKTGPLSFFNKLLPTKTPEVKFAMLNFTDLQRTVRCNPFDSRYIKNNLELKEMIHVLMKSLEKAWIQKTDFWAQNAINYAEGCALMLKKNHPEYFTIPHLVEFILSDFDIVLEYCERDSEVRQLMLPIMTAYKQNAEGQIAGAVSSSQLPVTKLNTKEIYWVLNPPVAQAFDLNISNPQKPVYFCVCNSPKLRQALSPVISLITTVCKNQMNQLKKHKALFVVDELPTQYIPQLDQLPAEARKKGVVTFLLAQTFKQLERSYTKDDAEITRDNCSNQFYFKTNSLQTAKHVSELYGEYRRADESISVSDSGNSKSTSTSLKRERILQPSDIRNQDPGHCTGFLAKGEPSRFHTQFDLFDPELKEIPKFSKAIETGDEERDLQHLQQLVDQNYVQVKSDIQTILEGFQVNNKKEHQAA